ncbi:hypothetical protein ACP70R_037007 [Stipagrostis hirtigluma subsp. patula]
MAWDVGSSSTNRRGGSSNLPLVTCPDCKWRQVVELTATTDWNYGRIFNTCPNHKRDGSGCEFWFWEDDYVKYLQAAGKIGRGGEGVKEARTGTGGQKPVRETKPAVTMVDQRNRRFVDEEEALKERFSALVGIAVAMVGVGKEIVWLLKAILGVCVLMLFGIVMSVCMQLKN